MSQKLIMDSEAIARALKRISHQIVERNKGVKDLCLIGIHKRGISIAKRVAAYIKEFEGSVVPVGVVDISFYRDDLSLIDWQTVVNSTDIPFEITEKTAVLVDDVLYTGRTARAAMDALMDIGRPSRIELAVLIDRGHRELPIRADYTGKNVPTSKNEIVQVSMPEFDGKLEVNISQK